MFHTKYHQELKRLLILVIATSLLLPGFAASPRPAQALTGSAASVLGPSPLWGADSPFNMRIPQGATYTRETRIGSFRYGYKEWSMPITRVAPDENVPIVTVINRYSGRVAEWPIPIDAQPAPASDAHMGVMHPGSNVIYEMWDVTWVDSSTIRAGGMVEFPLDGTGISDPPHYRVTASGFAVSAGMIVREDLTDTATGSLSPVEPIQHALAMSLPFDLVAPDEYVAPAVGGESQGRARADGVPLGAHFALPPDLDVDSLDVHPLTREILRAARDYGIYINDTNGAPLYNGKFAGSIRIEPELVEATYGIDHYDLQADMQADIYTVIQAHGIYRVTLPAVAAPVAVDDSYTVAEGATLEVPAPGVLANDSDINGDTLTANTTHNPANGMLTLHQDGGFAYTPNAGFSGVDTFTYMANDGQHDSAAAQVTINVTAAPSQNQAPTTGEDTYTLSEDARLDISAPGVLTNDDDLDGDPLTALLNSAPQHGTLDLQASGAFSYNPDANYSGTDSFTYRASDGVLGSTITTVSLTIAAQNDAPILEPVADQTVTAGETLAFVMSASDIDSPSLTFSAAGLPAGATLDSTSGAFNWTPETAQIGSYPLTVTVSDGDLTASTALIITVQDGASEPPPVVEPPTDALFADNFESGSLSAWDKAVTRKDTLAVTPQAALEGVYGMQITVDNRRSRYVRAYLPGEQAAGYLSFLFMPNDLQMANGDMFNLLLVGESNRTHSLRLSLRHNGTSYQLRAETRADNGRWQRTDWIDIANASQTVGLAWQQASEGLSNGTLTLMLNGTTAATIHNVDNDQRGISQVQWGAPGGLDNGTRGTFYLDSFAIHADSMPGTTALSQSSIAPAGNCTLSAAYWFTHGENGPEAFDPTWQALGLAGSQTEFLWGYSYSNVLWQGTYGAGIWFQLGKEYIAALLNQQHGAVLPAELSDAYTLAQEMLSSQNPREPLSEAHRSTFEILAENLEQFNTGQTGPGGCSGF